jgi:pathogenesis-related protein 1
MKTTISHQFSRRLLVGILFLAVGLSSGLIASAQNDTSSVSIQQILDAHNAYREEVGIPRLTWSDSLARYARQWANELAHHRGCVLQHRPYDAKSPWNQLYGENIFMGGGTDWKPTVLDAVAGWGSEKEYYDADDNKCKNGKVCGHYTQIVWKNTTQVGCGVAGCPDGYVIIVCNYNPPGNYEGERPY